MVEKKKRNLNFLPFQNISVDVVSIPCTVWSSTQSKLPINFIAYPTYRVFLQKSVFLIPQLQGQPLLTIDQHDKSSHTNLLRDYFIVEILN